MQTMQQRRAAHALTQVEKVINDKETNAAIRSRFKAYCQAMPAMIHMNGLGQTAAFYKSKANGHGAKADAYGKVYEILSDWLTREGQPYHTSANLLVGITGQDMQRYRLAQAEALAYLDWLKKFAEAFIEDKEAVS